MSEIKIFKLVLSFVVVLYSFAFASKMVDTKTLQSCVSALLCPSGSEAGCLKSG